MAGALCVPVRHGPDIAKAGSARPGAVIGPGRRAVGLLAWGCLAATFGLASASAADAPTPLEILKAWAPAVDRKGADTPLYMTIINRGAEPDDLLRVRCPAANFSEKRTTDYGEGAPAGREIKSIPIPASETSLLKPGGYHVVLLKTTQPLAPGEVFSCSIAFRKAGSRQVDVTVMAADAHAAPSD